MQSELGMNRLLVSVAFLCMFVVAQADAKAARYWLDGSVNSYLYDDITMKKISTSRRSGYATVSPWVGVTKVDFDDGTVRYLDNAIFEALSKDDYSYIMIEVQRQELGPDNQYEGNRTRMLARKAEERGKLLAEQKKKEQEEAERTAVLERAEESRIADLQRAEEARIADQQRAEVKIALKKIRFTNGTQVWTRFPIEFHPGLAKLKIKEVRVSDNLDIRVDYVSEFRTDTLVFENLDNLKSTFLFKYPNQWSGKIVKNITNGEIILGMTKDQAVASVGLPEDINRTVGKWGVHEQWVYTAGLYLYFKNGSLTSWQD